MLSSHTHPQLSSFWFFVSTVSAAVLQPLQAINNQLLSPYGSSNGTGTGIIDLFNATAVISSPSADLNEIRAQCNSEKFGSGLNIASCRKVLDDIHPDDNPESFGRRHDGTRYTSHLPYRWLSDDGQCSVELYLIAPSTIAHATSHDIKNAAQALFDKCTALNPAVGGVASRIGGDNRLAVVMRPTHYPNVVCYPMPSPLPSVAGRRLFLRRCNAVELDMDATPERQIFGPRSAPGVAVGLPTGFSDVNNKCLVQVVDNGLADSTTWLRVWEEVSAIVHICVFRGYVGKSTGIGTHGNIGVELYYHP